MTDGTGKPRETPVPRLMKFLAIFGAVVAVAALLVALCALHPPDPPTATVEAVQKGGAQSFPVQIRVLVTNRTSKAMTDMKVAIEPEKAEQQMQFDGALGQPPLNPGQVAVRSQGAGPLTVEIDRVRIGQSVDLQASARFAPTGKLRIDAADRKSLVGNFQCQSPPQATHTECPLQFPGTGVGLCNLIYVLTNPIMGK